MTNINTTFPLASTLLNDLRFLFVGSTEKAAYYADEISSYVLVDGDGLNLLESKLADGIEGAYDEWCSETDTVIFDADSIELTHVGDEFVNGNVITSYYETQHGVQVMIHLRPSSTRLFEAEGYVDGEADLYVSQLLAEILNDLDQDQLAEKAGFYNDEEGDLFAAV